MTHKTRQDIGTRFSILFTPKNWMDMGDDDDDDDVQMDLTFSSVVSFFL